MSLMLASAFVYSKGIYSFRVFDSLRNLVLTIGHCLADMKDFLILIITMVFMFAALNNIVPYHTSTGMPKDFLLHLEDQYKILFGDNPAPENGTQWVLFIIFSVFTIILNLNLLIALISDSYVFMNE